ncbi:MAG: hypothetical protein U0946_04155, partial [Patescibacteria group bacterium]|nr:hypothetical protein [Patescibacteria group bacterium]
TWAETAVTMTEMIGHVAETAGHDEPKTESVTMGRNPRSRYRNQRSRWSEIPKAAVEIANRPVPNKPLKIKDCC